MSDDTAQLAGKTVLMTGGAGRATAEGLARLWRAGRPGRPARHDLTPARPGEPTHRRKDEQP